MFKRWGVTLMLLTCSCKVGNLILISVTHLKMWWRSDLTNLEKKNLPVYHYHCPSFEICIINSRDNFSEDHFNLLKWVCVMSFTSLSVTSLLSTCPVDMACWFFSFIGHMLPPSLFQKFPLLRCLGKSEAFSYLLKWDMDLRAQQLWFCLILFYSLCCERENILRLAVDWRN